jgi:hypothetical protein
MVANKGLICVKLNYDASFKLGYIYKSYTIRLTYKLKGTNAIRQISFETKFQKNNLRASDISNLEFFEVTSLHFFLNIPSAWAIV